MTTSATPYAIRTIVFEAGERMPILVHAASGIPVFDACVYAATVVRPRSGSSATVDQALRGVQFLLSFIDARGIDLDQRFISGEFLGLHELDDLLRMAYRPMSSFDRTQHYVASAQDSVPNLANFRQIVRGRLTPSDEQLVAIGTASIRLHYVRTYLEWFGHRLAGKICNTLEQKRHYLEALKECLGRLRARTPMSRGESKRESLSIGQKQALTSIIDPVFEANPWSGEFVRDRNRLLILWGLGTGLRRGELLGLRIKMIDFRRNIAQIMRRPDDRRDPRMYQPNTKTRERGIGISDELAFLTHQHIVQFRSRIKGAKKHDFLFVAEGTGRPLSLAAMSKVFRSLRDKHPVLGDTISSHVLRHTWNEDFSEIVDKAQLSVEDERRARVHAMGWSEMSKSADHYLKRRTARIATEASVRIQQAVINGIFDDSADA